MTCRLLASNNESASVRSSSVNWPSAVRVLSSPSSSSRTCCCDADSDASLDSNFGSSSSCFDLSSSYFDLSSFITSFVSSFLLCSLWGFSLSFSSVFSSITDAALAHCSSSFTRCWSFLWFARMFARDCLRLARLAVSCNLSASSRSRELHVGKLSSGTPLISGATATRSLRERAVGEGVNEGISAGFSRARASG